MTNPVITINGKPIAARIGETLIDAGLGGRILIPHDCCSGQCSTCRVTLVDGAVDDQGTAEGKTVLACQATVSGPASITFEDVPVPSRRTGIVKEIKELSPDILEVSVALGRPLDYLPGQYVSVRFSGFPARDYSPTAYMSGDLDPGVLVFHIRRYSDGVVSSRFGSRIRPGHKVRIRGPFGNAFLRPPQENGILVLVSAGTGWAPIWSLARAACIDHGKRDIVVIAGARDGANLYMSNALHWLRDHGVSDIITTCGQNQGSDDVNGRPFHYLPTLGIHDTVYVAGGPGVVTEVESRARAANVRCYTDPFLPSGETPGLFARLSGNIRLNGWTSAPDSYKPV